MTRIAVTIEEVDDLEDDDGHARQGVVATCSECDHTTESFGTSDKSRKRCLALMRDECPKKAQDNWYFDDETDDY